MNELVKVINESGVEESTALTLQKSFLPFFEQAEKWNEKAKELIVTDVSQTREMKMAREARLALKEIRVNADKTRKALKEDSIRYGKAVQGVYNVIEYLIVPIEKHLEEQEKFPEIQEEKRVKALEEERQSKILPYAEFVPFASNLGKLTDEQFDKLFTGAKLQYDAKIEAERKAEQERIAREKADAEERERIRIENERLKAEAIEREKAAKAEREAAEKKQREIEEAARKDREAAEAEKKRLQAEYEEKQRAEAEKRKQAEETERKERERLQAQLRAREQAEEAERTRAEAEKEAQLKAEKAAAKAPDKIKLQKLIESISFPESEMKTAEGKELYNSLRLRFDGFKNWATNQINSI